MWLALSGGGGRLGVPSIGRRVVCRSDRTVLVGGGRVEVGVGGVVS